MVIKSPGRDGGHLLRLAQAGQAEAVVPAHQLQEPAHGVDLLVVAVTLDGGDQIALLALHEALQKGPPLQGGIQQNLAQKIRHGLQHPVAGQGEALVHKAAVQPGGLAVAHPAHQGAEGSAVKIVQRQGNIPQAGMPPGTPQQHRPQQRIHSRLAAIHGPHQLHTEAPLLEPPIPKTPQRHTGRKLKGLYHGELLNWKNIWWNSLP